MKRKEDRNGNWQYVKHRQKKMSTERKTTENRETGKMELQKLKEEDFENMLQRNKWNSKFFI